MSAIGEGTATIKVTATLRGISREGSMSIIVDNTPPTTTALTHMPDHNGWYNSDVTVSLSAQDHLSSISKTEFRMGSEGNWTWYSVPIPLTNEGTFIIQYRSVDHAGNTEELKQDSFSIDRTLPSFKLSADGQLLHTGGSFDIGVPLTFQVSDALSGVTSAQLTVTGITYRIDLQASSAIDIYFTGRAGNYTAAIFLEDVAGNTLETEFAFSVTVSIDSIRNLLVGYMGSGNASGPLFNNLDQAQHHLDQGRKEQAAKHLQDFIKHLDNAALGATVSEQEKQILQVNTDALIRMWSEE